DLVLNWVVGEGRRAVLIPRGHFRIGGFEERGLAGLTIDDTDALAAGARAEHLPRGVVEGKGLVRFTGVAAYHLARVGAGEEAVEGSVMGGQAVAAIVAHLGRAGGTADPLADPHPLVDAVISHAARTPWVGTDFRQQVAVVIGRPDREPRRG